MALTYAVGDLHGSSSKLIDLIAKCEQDAGDRDYKIIFLGDYVDRGPDSKGCIEHLMMLQFVDPEKYICLVGNHEIMLLDAVDDQRSEARWLRNGGAATLYSYQVTDPIDIPKPHIDWIRSLPFTHDDGLRLFVHAGIHPDRPLDQQDEYDLVWIREPFLSSTVLWEKYIVHGHTPLRDGKPDIRQNRTNLDTGAVYGGPLTAAVFSHEASRPLRFIASN